jgi:hypothetical protein
MMVVVSDSGDTAAAPLRAECLAKELGRHNIRIAQEVDSRI